MQAFALIWDWLAVRIGDTLSAIVGTFQRASFSYAEYEAEALARDLASLGHASRPAAQLADMRNSAIYSFCPVAFEPAPNPRGFIDLGRAQPMPDPEILATCQYCGTTHKLPDSAPGEIIRLCCLACGAPFSELPALFAEAF